MNGRNEERLHLVLTFYYMDSCVCWNFNTNKDYEWYIL